MRPADSVTLETCDSALRKSEEVPRVRNFVWAGRRRAEGLVPVHKSAAERRFRRFCVYAIVPVLVYYRLG